MAHPIPINGEVLRDLRAVRLLSQEGLARKAGCTREEISAYERGVREPTPAALDRIITALEHYPVKAVQWQLVQTPALDQALATIEGQMNRRELAKLLTAAATGAGAGAVILTPGRSGGALPPPRLLHEDTIALAARYRTTSPVFLLPDARHHLDVVTDALEGPLKPGERTGLLVDAAETASLAARCARLAGFRGQANAYFGLAQSLADESRYDTLIGCTRIAAAGAHGPLVAGGDGNWVTALDMINSALPLIGTSGPRAGWAQYNLAQQYADLHREPETMVALERFQAARHSDGGEGFFSTQGWFPAADWFDGAAGRCYGLLGRTDEALAHLARELAAGPLLLMAHHTDVMLTHACAGNPEAMCDAAHVGLDLTLATPEGAHRLAVAEIRGARRKLPDPCADAECVRALDDRLAAI